MSKSNPPKYFQLMLELTTTALLTFLVYFLQNKQNSLEKEILFRRDFYENCFKIIEKAIIENDSEIHKSKDWIVKTYLKLAKLLFDKDEETSSIASSSLLNASSETTPAVSDATSNMSELYEFFACSIVNNFFLIFIIIIGLLIIVILVMKYFKK